MRVSQVTGHAENKFDPMSQWTVWNGAGGEMGKWGRGSGKGEREPKQDGKGVKCGDPDGHRAREVGESSVRAEFRVGTGGKFKLGSPGRENGGVRGTEREQADGKECGRRGL